MHHLKQLPRRAFGYSMLILILLVASAQSMVPKARSKHRRDDHPTA
jgi:hypothetical protein